MLEIIYDPCLGIPSYSIYPHELQNNLRKVIENHIQLHCVPSLDTNFYLIHNGKKLDEICIPTGVIHVVPCLKGGKGGFGSMLRAIGAQIEKTTNREACRDLSGRRLRDINEEKRLKKWISEQADREKEAAEKKKKKFKKLCIEPKHEFSDPDYDKSRSELTEKVHDAVEEGLKSSKTQSNLVLKEHESTNKKKKKIKGSLWVDDLDELEDFDSEVESNSDEEPLKKKRKSEKLFE